MEWTRAKLATLGFNNNIIKSDVFLERWKMVGDRYRIVKRDDIIDRYTNFLLIKDEAWDEIEALGTIPLSKCIFKYKCKYLILSESLYESYIESREKLFGVKERKHQGIYGIYVNNELYYIGMTMRDFKERWQEHLDIINKKVEKPQGMIIYNYIKKDDKVEFKILIDATDLDTDGEITERDVKAMELALITTMKPKYNYAGVKGPYRW